MTSRTTTIIALIAASLLFMGCNKDQINSSLDASKNGYTITDIPYFENHAILANTIKEASSFEDVDELIQYEKSQNRISIGAEADSFYRTIQPENLGTTQAMINFYIAHSDLLDTTTNNNEISISPKWFSTPYRYAANRDGLFRVGTRVYRLFKKGTLSTDINNLNQLVSITENELDNIDTSTFKYCCNNSNNSKAGLHAGCFLPWNVSDTLTQGDDRIIMSLTTSLEYYSEIGQIAETRVHTFSQHRWALIWWVSNHTLTCQGYVTWHEKIGTDSWKYDTTTINDSQHTTNLWSYVNDYACYLGNNFQYFHYYAFNLKASTPSLAYATLVFVH